MRKETETMKHNAEVAQFRFALIAPVIQGLFPDASATAYYKRVSAAPLTLPDGTSVKYSYKTLEKWKFLYSIGGLDALMPVSRSDKGTSRSLNDEAVADTCYLPYITEDVHSRRVYCIMIIDNHSRLLVGGGLFYNDNAYNFQKVLKNAIAAYGIPDKLYVDNGCSYSNEQLSMICVSYAVPFYNWYFTSNCN